MLLVAILGPQKVHTHSLTPLLFLIKKFALIQISNLKSHTRTSNPNCQIPDPQIPNLKISNPKFQLQKKNQYISATNALCARWNASDKSLGIRWVSLRHHPTPPPPINFKTHLSNIFRGVRVDWELIIYKVGNSNGSRWRTRTRRGEDGWDEEGDDEVVTVEALPVYKWENSLYEVEVGVEVSSGVESSAVVNIVNPPPPAYSLS
jgi:hypothetical protein